MRALMLKTTSKTVSHIVWHRFTQAENAFSFLDAEQKWDAKSQLVLLVELLDILTPSKQTHYHQLDEWSTIVHQFLNEQLSKSGFVNADPQTNALRPMVVFWFGILGIFDSIIYSPNLKTGVANHHSSASERNKAFKIEVDELIKLTA